MAETISATVVLMLSGVALAFAILNLCRKHLRINDSFPWSSVSLASCLNSLYSTGCTSLTWGVLLYLQGCVLFEVFREIGGVITSPSKTVDSLCLLLNNCSKFIEQKDVPVNKLTFPMLLSKATKCKLKVKATEARRLLPCTLHLIQNIFPPKSDRSRMRLECVSKMRRRFELMDDWSPDSGVEFVMVGRQFLALHSLMCQESREHPSNMHAVWSEYPKHHLMDHLLDDVSSRGNPKESWSYSEESEIGLCAELAGALHPRTVKTMLLQRHRL